MNSTLGDLKHLIQQLSIRDRWVLLKWLVEWLQQESHIYAEPEEATFLDLIAQS